MPDGAPDLYDQALSLSDSQDAGGGSGDDLYAQALALSEQRDAPMGMGEELGNAGMRGLYGLKAMPGAAIASVPAALAEPFVHRAPSLRESMMRAAAQGGGGFKDSSLVSPQPQMSPQQPMNYSPDVMALFAKPNHRFYAAGQQSQERMDAAFGATPMPQGPEQPPADPYVQPPAMIDESRLPAMNGPAADPRMQGGDIAQLKAQTVLGGRAGPGATPSPIPGVLQPFLIAGQDAAEGQMAGAEAYPPNPEAANRGLLNPMRYIPGAIENAPQLIAQTAFAYLTGGGSAAARLSGFVAGGVPISAAQGFTGRYQAFREQGKTPDEAAAASGLPAVLDAIGDAVLDRLGGEGLFKDATAKAGLKAAAKDYLMRGLEGFAKEGVTEGMQEIKSAGLDVMSGSDPTAGDLSKLGPRVLDASVIGGLLGAPAAVGGRFVEGFQHGAINDQADSLRDSAGQPGVGVNERIGPGGTVEPVAGAAPVSVEGPQRPAAGAAAAGVGAAPVAGSVDGGASASAAGAPPLNEGEQLLAQLTEQARADKAGGIRTEFDPATPPEIVKAYERAYREAPKAKRAAAKPAPKVAPATDPAWIAASEEAGRRDRMSGKAMESQHLRNEGFSEDEVSAYEKGYRATATAAEVLGSAPGAQARTSPSPARVAEGQSKAAQAAAKTPDTTSSQVLAQAPQSASARSLADSNSLPRSLEEATRANPGADVRELPSGDFEVIDTDTGESTIVKRNRSAGEGVGNVGAANVAEPAAPVARASDQVGGVARVADDAGTGGAVEPGLPPVVGDQGAPAGNQPGDVAGQRLRALRGKKPATPNVAAATSGVAAPLKDPRFTKTPDLFTELRAAGIEPKPRRDDLVSQVKELRKAGAPANADPSKAQNGATKKPAQAVSANGGPTEGPSVETDLAAFATEARSRIEGNTRYIDHSSVSADTADRIKSLIGVDVSNFRHSLDESAVRHILNEHGDDPVPVVESDFSKIPDIVSNPDSISNGKAAKGKPERIVYSKRINGYTIFVEEARTGRQKLAAVTMYKVAGESGVPQTSETISTLSRAPDAADSSATQSIGVVDAPVKPNGEDRATAGSGTVKPDVAGKATGPKVSATETAAPKRTHEFSSTQIDLPSDIAAKVRALAQQIPASDLADEGREAEPHVTIKYGLKTDDAAAVGKLLADQPPITVKLGKTSLFENDDADVVKIDVESPALHVLNAKIAGAIENGDTRPEYVPHVTLAYVKKGEGAKYAGKSDMAGQSMTIDTLTFSDRDGKKTAIRLEGKPERSTPAKPWELPQADYVRKALQSDISRYERAIAQKKQEQGSSRKGSLTRTKADNALRLWEPQLEGFKAEALGKRGNQTTKHEKDYVEIVRKAISSGQPVPATIIDQSPEFSKARDARARYDKGRHTSFANRSLAVDDSMRADRGYKVKRQDGKPITESQKREIAEIVGDVEKAVGPLADLMRNSNLTIAHTSGTFPFMNSSAAGLYHSNDRTITVGTADQRAGAHELGHWLDIEAGNAKGLTARVYSKSSKSYESKSMAEAATGRQHSDDALVAERALIERATRAMHDPYAAAKMMSKNPSKLTDGAEKEALKAIQFKLTPYWRSPREVWARLFEQYVASKLTGRTASQEGSQTYENTPAWWSKSEFESLVPGIERAIAYKRELLASVTPPAETDAQPISTLDKIIAAADTAEEAAKDRLKQSGIPRGRGAGAAINPIAELYDHAVIIASRVIKAGARGLKAINTAYTKAVAESGARLDAEAEKRVKSEAARIIRETYKLASPALRKVGDRVMIASSPRVSGTITEINNGLYTVETKNALVEVPLDKLVPTAGEAKADVGAFDKATEASRARMKVDAAPPQTPVQKAKNAAKAQQKNRADVAETTAPTTVPLGEAIKARLEGENRAGKAGAKAGFTAGEEVGKLKGAGAEARKAEAATTKTVENTSDIAVPGVANSRVDRRFITASDALRAGLRKAARAAAIGYRAGRDEALEKFKVELEAVHQRAKDKAVTAGQMRARVAKLVRQMVPDSHVKRFLNAIAQTRTDNQVDQVAKRVFEVVAESRVKLAAEAAHDAAGGAKLEKMLEEHRELLSAARKEIKALTAKLAALGKPGGPVKTVAALDAIRVGLNDAGGRAAFAIAQHKLDQKTHVEGKAIRTEEAVREFVRAIGAKPQASPENGIFGVPDITVAKFGLQTVLQASTPSTIAAMIGSDVGTDLMVRQAREAENASNQLRQRAKDALMSILAKHGYEPGSLKARELSEGAIGRGKARFTAVKIGGHTVPMTAGMRMEVYAMLGDVGSGSNIAAGAPVRFMRNGKEVENDHPMSADEVRDFIAKMPADLKGIVDDCKAWYKANVTPEMAATFRRENGYDLQLVPGYHAGSRVAAVKEKEGPQSQNALTLDGAAMADYANFVKSFTPSMVKERDAKAIKAPYLAGDFFGTWSRMVAHSSAYIHMTQPVRELTRIIEHGDVKNALALKYGYQKGKESGPIMLRRLREIAQTMQLVSASRNGDADYLARWYPKIKRNLARAYLPLGVTSMAKNLTGIAIVASRAAHPSDLKGLWFGFRPQSHRDILATVHGRSRYEQGAAVMATQMMGDGGDMLGRPSKTALLREGRLGALADRLPLFEAADRVPYGAAYGMKLAEAERTMPTASKAQQKAWALKEAETIIRDTQNPSSRLEMTGFGLKAQGTIGEELTMFANDGLAKLNILLSAHARGDKQKLILAYAGVATAMALAGLVDSTKEWLKEKYADAVGASEFRKARPGFVEAWALGTGRQVFGLHYFGKAFADLAETAYRAVRGYPISPIDSPMTGPVVAAMMVAADHTIGLVAATRKAMEELPEKRAEAARRAWLSLVEKVAIDANKLGGNPFVSIYGIVRPTIARGSEGPDRATALNAAAAGLRDGGDPAVATRAIKALLVGVPPGKRYDQRTSIREALEDRGPRGKLSQDDWEKKLRMMTPEQRNEAKKNAAEWERKVRNAIEMAAGS